MTGSAAGPAALVIALRFEQEDAPVGQRDGPEVHGAVLVAGPNFCRVTAVEQPGHMRRQMLGELSPHVSVEVGPGAATVLGGGVEHGWIGGPQGVGDAVTKVRCNAGLSEVGELDVRVGAHGGEAPAEVCVIRRWARLGLLPPGCKVHRGRRGVGFVWPAETAAQARWVKSQLDAGLTPDDVRAALSRGDFAP